MVIGFVDNNGGYVPFPQITEGEGDWGDISPFVMAMAEDEINRQKQVSSEALDISVTELSSPVRQVALSRRYDVFVKPLRFLDSWEGSTMHARMAKVNGEAEREIFASTIISGIRVGGHIDRFQNNVIFDYKWTKVKSWKWIEQQGIKKAKPEWWKQLNCYDWLLKKNGHTVNRKAVIVRFKDWGLREWKLAQDANEPYPPAPLHIIEIPSYKGIEGYIQKQIDSYIGCIDLDDKELPVCTDGETRNGIFCDYCDYEAQCKEATLTAEFENIDF